MYNRLGNYIEEDTSLLHATKEGAHGNDGMRYGFAHLPWVKRTVTYPDGKTNDGSSYGSMYHAIAQNDPFHWYRTDLPVYNSQFAVNKPRRRVVR